MSKPYIIIIYAGATTKGANSIIADNIAQGIKKSGLNVMGPIDINFETSNEENELISKITNASGIIIGSGVYNGNIEPSLLNFFDIFAGAGFKSSFLASKVAGQFATAADSGTGGQLVLNSLSRLMQTFGANIVTGGASRSTLGKPGSGSWHTAQGILGITTKDKTGKTTFTNKYIEEDAQAYGERIGQIASFFENQYNKSMNLPEPKSGNTCNPQLDTASCPQCHKNKNFNIVTIIILIIIVIILSVLLLCFYFKILQKK